MQSTQHSASIQEVFCSGQHFPSFKKNVLKRTNTLYPRARSAALLISRACGRKALLCRMGTSSDFPGRPLSYGLNLGLGSCFKEERKKNADEIDEKQVGTFVYSTQLEESTCDHRLWISASEEHQGFPRSFRYSHSASSHGCTSIARQGTRSPPAINSFTVKYQE